MTIVVGTAGHIDHGKTTLLRALTGIDADRLPEERRRGLTIDVGYAHMALPGGRSIDFVDVPGHDELVGNMLVGAGEIDAAMLVVAADDGPRAQTLEHLALLDGLGIRYGLAAVTRTDLVEAARVAAVTADVRELLARTCLAGAPVLPVSATTEVGLEALRAALADLDARFAGDPHHNASGRSARLAIDRVFSVRGRGTIVTGSLRGGSLAAGMVVRIQPGAGQARVREIQVHNVRIDGATGPGRTAVNLASIEAASLDRGQVLAGGPGLEVSDRLLVELRPPAVLTVTGEPRAWPPADRSTARLHAGTAQAGARIGRSGREAVTLDAAGEVAPEAPCTALLRLEAPVAVAIGDRFVLRRPSPGLVVAGGTVLDPLPPTAGARRRVTPPRLAALATAIAAQDASAAVAALVELHGYLSAARAANVVGAIGGNERGTTPTTTLLADDLAGGLASAALAAVAAHHVGSPLSPGIPVAELRPVLAARLRRGSSASAAEAADAATAVLARQVRDGALGRDGERLRDPVRRPGLPAELSEAMDRLEARLSVAAPPPLEAAARDARCPADGVRALEAAGRIVRLERDLAWAAPAWHRLVAQALSMARSGPLSPAAFRDATGTSRRYVLAILEDLDRRGILLRTPAGHVPGPKAPAAQLPPPAVAPVAEPAR